LLPIRYSQIAIQDAVAEMAAEIESDDWLVGNVDGKTFLKAVLNKLKVPEESQVLVFSKMSLQNSLINQRNPRSIYFSIDTYVGWVRREKVEVIVGDEKLGPVFLEH
jgi:predicted 2-oxoglutarate/Fe(II)-dependent dioxygenase YbiX